MSQNAIRFTSPRRRCETCGRPATYQTFDGRRRWRRGITLCRQHVRALRDSIRRKPTCASRRTP